jgi:hypothetical protein
VPTTILTYVPEMPCSNFGQTPAVLAEAFRSFPQFLVANVGIVPKIMSLLFHSTSFPVD